MSVIPNGIKQLVGEEVEIEDTSIKLDSRQKEGFKPLIYYNILKNQLI